jgi:phosphatidylserine decarboxylase
MRPTVFPAIHREGWPFIAIFIVAAIILSWIHGSLGFLGLLLTAWCVYFFRDPVRVTPMRSGLVVSPADGIVVSLGPTVPPSELGLGDQPLPCVAVFMNVFDVHVNRAPVTGRIRHMAYRPGRFFNASLDKASEHNERNGVVFELPDGRAVGAVQIAGLVARRIVWWVGVGDAMTAGSRFGMIRFGSRVDVYLPLGVTPQVCIGQRMVAGETVLADLQSSEALRPGFAS